jgi:hypothetical protein
MEVEEDLFRRTDSQGLHYWDLVRVNIGGGLDCAYGGPFRNPALDERSTVQARVKNVVKDGLNRLTRSCLMRRNPDFLFYTVQRTLQGSRLVDSISDPVLEVAGPRAIAKETMNRASIDFSRLLVGKPTRVPPPYLHTAPDSDCEEISQQIDGVLRKHFDRHIDLEGLIREPLAVYHEYREFFSRLFERVQPRAVVVFNNGLLKGMFRAAKERGIRTVELQHGASSMETLFWSYPPSVKSDHVGLTLPTEYWTFSDYWNRVSNYPTRRAFAIGNDMLAQPVVPNIRDAVVIISAYMYQLALEQLAGELSLKLPNQTIYFKLHPHQFKDKEAIRHRLSRFPEIVVLSDEMTLGEMLATTTFVIGIHSTLLYSAVQARKIVMLFAFANYFFHSDIFDFVETFDDAASAAAMIKFPDSYFRNLDSAPEFFSAFDVEKCKKLLDSSPRDFSDAGKPCP